MYKKSRIPNICLDRSILETMVKSLPECSIGVVIKNILKFFNGEEKDKDLEVPEDIFLNLLVEKAKEKADAYLRQHPTKEEKAIYKEK